MITLYISTLRQLKINTFYYSPKLIPWFVSDVTPPDFKETFEILSDPSFFPDNVVNENRTGAEHLYEMVSRWRSYLDKGVFSLSTPVETPLGGDASSDHAHFWTTPRPYWNMQTEAVDTFSQLEKSDLVIFKVNISAFSFSKLFAKGLFRAI